MGKLIFIDMDDVLADFGGAESLKGMPINDHTVAEMYALGFFRDLKPVDGALTAVRQLLAMGYDVQILTQPVKESAHCYLEKVQWVGAWLPELISKINMVQDKGIAVGDYLVDDRADKWQAKFEANGGTFVYFEYDRTGKRNKEIWQRIVDFFIEEHIYEIRSTNKI
jgi:5'(3')-deoxyribonucleotidase